MAITADLKTARWLNDEILFATGCSAKSLQNATVRLPRLMRPSPFDFVQGGGPRFYSTRDAFFLAAFGEITRRGVTPNVAGVYALYVRDFAADEMALQWPNCYRDLYELYFIFVGPHSPEPIHVPAGELTKVIGAYPAALVVNVTRIIQTTATKLREAAEARRKPEGKNVLSSL